MRGAFVFLLASSLVSAVCAPAKAQERVGLLRALEVDPADECIDRAALAARIEALLGTDQIEATLSISVAPGPAGGLTFVLRRDEVETARRTFDVLPAACESRVAAVGLALALAIDHTLLTRLASAEPAGSIARQATPTEREATPQMEASAATDRAEPSRDTPGGTPPETQLGLELSALTLVSVLPEVAFGGAFVVELRHQLISVRGRVFGAGALKRALGPGHFESAVVAGSLAGCLTHRDGVLAVGGCVGLSAGLFHAAGIDFDDNRALDAALLTTTGEAFLALSPIDELAIRIGVEAMIHLLRPAVTVLAGDATVASTELPVAGFAPSVGVVLWLP